MKSKKITLDKLLIANRRKTVLLVISLVGLSIFAPLKSFVKQWLVNSSNKKEVFMNFLLGMPITRPVDAYAAAPVPGRAKRKLASCDDERFAND